MFSEEIEMSHYLERMSFLAGGCLLLGFLGCFNAANAATLPPSDVDLPNALKCPLHVSTPKLL